MKSFLKKIWKPLFVLSPLIVGMIGFYLEDAPFLQSLFNCVCLYTLNYQDPPANVLIELARWLAPLVTASAVVMIIAALRKYMSDVIARCTGRSVAVYGPEAETAPVLEELGIRGIAIAERPVTAHSYILLGDESDNLRFYQKNRRAFGKKDVYLKCTSLPGQASADSKLHLFCPEETAAQFFWKENCPYELCSENGYQMKIVLLGFGKLGKELLLKALQNNIFHPQQKIEYHIFGDDEGFQTVYRQLGEISDPVLFHPEPWHESKQILEQAQMVIVVQQENQLALLNDLTLCLHQKPFHVLAADPHGVEILAAQAKLIPYYWQQQTQKLENILGTKLHNYAKRINLRYAYLYGGVEETDANKEAEWAKLNAFTRYSNISAADYHDVQVKMLAGRELSGDVLELFSELEHIRWCRYHYLNNWQLGTPANGKAKDAQARIHVSLIPYADLVESEKEKDRENVRMLFSLDQ